MVFFDTVFDSMTLACESTNHRAGSQLKILPITLYVHKIALPENVTLTYTLSYGVHEFLKVCHPLFKTLATLAMVIVSTFALKSVQPC